MHAKELKQRLTVHKGILRDERLEDDQGVVVLIKKLDGTCIAGTIESTAMFRWDMLTKRVFVLLAEEVEFLKDLVEFQSLKVDKNEISYFGGCPQCGKNDGYVDIGCDHWFVCNEHKTKWWEGSNLFSAWREQTEEKCQKNREMLAEYRAVKPIYEKE